MLNLHLDLWLCLRVPQALRGVPGDAVVRNRSPHIKLDLQLLLQNDFHRGENTTYEEVTGPQWRKVNGHSVSMVTTCSVIIVDDFGNF